MHVLFILKNVCINYHLLFISNKISMKTKFPAWSSFTATSLLFSASYASRAQKENQMVAPQSSQSSLLPQGLSPECR